MGPTGTSHLAIKIYIYIYDLTTQQVQVATGYGFNTSEQIDIISPHFPSNHHQRLRSIYNRKYKCLCDLGRFKTYLHAKIMYTYTLTYLQLKDLFTVKYNTLTWSSECSPAFSGLKS